MKIFVCICKGEKIRGADIREDEEIIILIVEGYVIIIGINRTELLMTEIQS